MLYIHNMTSQLSYSMPWLRIDPHTLSLLCSLVLPLSESYVLPHPDPSILQCYQGSCHLVYTFLMLMNGTYQRIYISTLNHLKLSHEDMDSCSWKRLGFHLSIVSSDVWHCRSPGHYLILPPPQRLFLQSHQPGEQDLLSGMELDLTPQICAIQFLSNYFCFTSYCTTHPPPSWSSLNKTVLI